MGLLDKLTVGAEKVAKQAEKAFEQGKGKVEELQVERQLDGLAKKLGYMEFDAHRNRQVDTSARESLLTEMVQLEDQLTQMRQTTAEQGDGAATGTAEPGTEGTPAPPEAASLGGEAPSSPEEKTE